MKTNKKFAWLLLVAFIGSGCAAMNRLNAEYEEEMTRIENLSPEDKAEWEATQRPYLDEFE